MWLYSIISYLHIISIFVLFSALIVELSIIKKKMILDNLVLLRKADLFFGVFAGFTIITGLLRMYYFGKGDNYYLSNQIFIMKFLLFIIVGLLSIYPTVQFLKSRKLKSEFIELENFKTIKSLLIIELILLVLTPFLAVLVARGIGAL